jgi:hypothetical protein
VTRWNRFLHYLTGGLREYSWGWRISQRGISSEAAVIQLPATRMPMLRQQGGQRTWMTGQFRARRKGEQQGESCSQRQQHHRP